MRRTFLERPRQLAVRKSLFQIHLYTGLIVGVYVAIVGITGSSLVFRPEIEPSLIDRPTQRAADDSASFQTSWNELRRTFPGQAIYSFSLNQYPDRSPGEPYRVKLQQGNRTTFAYVDSSSGRVLGTQHPVIRFLQDLHFTLLAGEVGAVFNGLGAILLVVMCISGAVIWWPGRGDWKRGFIVSWRSSWQKFSYDLHGVIGITTTVLLAAVAVAGIYLVYETIYAYHPDEVSWQSGVQSWPVDLDVVVQRADAAVPGGVRGYLYFPKSPSDAFRFDKSVAGVPYRIFLDQFSASVMRVDSGIDTSARAWIEKWVGLIHYGRFWGTFSRSAWVLLGIAPLLLFVTGVVMWWKRTLVKMLRQRRAA